MPNLLTEVNPVTRLAVMVVLTTPLLLSLDWVSATVSLTLTVLLAPLCGVGWPRLIRLAWPLLIIAPMSGFSMLLYGKPGGHEYFTLWLAVVTENSVELAVAVMVRVLAVALPVVVLARGIDPTELGDGLAQVLRLPARFVIGAVAGIRMATLFRDDWAAMERARRARGLTDRGRIRHTASMSFGLLVVALRRGGKLATAMEARGFGRTPPGGRARTWARPSRMNTKDWLVIMSAVALAAVPVVASVVTNSWRFFGL